MENIQRVDRVHGQEPRHPVVNAPRIDAVGFLAKRGLMMQGQGRVFALGIKHEQPPRIGQQGRNDDRGSLAGTGTRRREQGRVPFQPQGEPSGPNPK